MYGKHRPELGLPWPALSPVVPKFQTPCSLPCFLLLIPFHLQVMPMWRSAPPAPGQEGPRATACARAPGL